MLARADLVPPWLRCFEALRWCCAWTGAVVLACLPFVIAADYGGVLHWTQYVAALAVGLVVALALISSIGQSDQGSLRRFLLLGPLAVWVAYAWFQTVPLPANLVSYLSPASYRAYTEWIEPFLTESQRPRRFPISLDAYSSRHAAGLLTVTFGLVWASLAIFRTRSRITWLLSAIAIGASMHAVIGLVGLADVRLLPAVSSAESPGAQFGTFVNRNNAALLFNLGLASSFGLLSWRLTALTGAEVDDEHFAIDDLVSLVSDRESMIGVAGLVCCMGGLLACGSRGGIAAAVVGTMLALGWVRRRRGLVSLPAVAVALAIGAAVILVPLNLSMQSLRRFGLFSGDSESLLRDGRLQHWPDGFRAALEHLPAGSGLGTYAYAYLPFQAVPETGLAGRAWYHHADNLWLELFTEQGLIGLSLALVLLAFVLRSLYRLNFSPDPVDQGLRITGWYALGAIVVSQFFDFGLIIASNLWLVCVLFAALSARGAETAVVPESDPEEPSDLAADNQATGTRRVAQRLSLSGRQRTGIFWAVALAAVGCVVFPMSTLRQDTIAASEVRRLSSDWAAVKTSPTSLEEEIKTFSKQQALTMRPAFTHQLSQLNYQQSRVAEVVNSRPVSERQFIARYRDTAPIRRGAGPLPWKTLNSQQVASGYANALHWSERELVTLPLSPSARAFQIYLDFVHQNPSRTSSAVDHLRQFYLTDADNLIKLGAALASRGRHEFASELWREALRLKPHRTAVVLAHAAQIPDFPLVDALPENNVVYRVAAVHELRNERPDKEVMRKAFEIVTCSSSSSRETRAECRLLQARVANELGMTEEAISRYVQAIELRPKDMDLRVEYIQKLRDDLRFDEARRFASLTAEAIPDAMPLMDKIKLQIGEQETRQIKAADGIRN